MTQAPFKQSISLSGLEAFRSAWMGTVLVAVGVVVLALHLPVTEGASLVGATVVAMPALALGLTLLAFACWSRVTRATWTVEATQTVVSLTIATRSGRVVQHEALPIVELQEVRWLEGDHDVRAGVRLRSTAGTSVFVPADMFDTEALLSFICNVHPAVRITGRQQNRSS